MTNLPKKLFSDSRLAQKNWNKLACLSNQNEKYLSFLKEQLSSSPDPDLALNSLEKLSSSIDSEFFIQEIFSDPPFLSKLIVLFSHSLYFFEILRNSEEKLLWLKEQDLTQVKPKEDLREEFSQYLFARFSQDYSLLLNEFKKRELTRIALRDLLNYGTLAEITLELSNLADILIENALFYSDQILRKKYGFPQFLDEKGRLEKAEFTVLSLGKLGGEELNYSSDIDLLFIYRAEGQTSGKEIISTSIISNREYFLKLASHTVEIVSSLTEEGQLYRIDLRLRPEGSQGEIASSLEEAVSYYKNWASLWERQSLIKARVSAGDRNLGKEFLTKVEPFIYDGTREPRIFSEIKNVKDKIDWKLTRQGTSSLDIKLGYGGIREIEFLVQALQLYYGQEDPWVRDKNSLLSISKLYDKGYLSVEDYNFLSQAYTFLRKLEHQLQIFQNLQTHSLPTEKEELVLLSKKMGFPSSDEFLSHLQQIRTGVRNLYDQFFFEFSQSHLVPLKEEKVKEVFEGKRVYSIFRKKIALRDAKELFSQINSSLYSFVNPQRGFKNLENFLEFISSKKIAAFFQNKSFIPPFLRLLAQSDFLSRLAIKLCSDVPSIVEENIPDSYWDLLEEKIFSKSAFSEKMNLARILQQREFLKLGWQEIRGQLDIFSVLDKISQLAETMVKISYMAALEEVFNNEKDATFSVIGLGNLGIKELDFHSDLDLFFVFQSDKIPARLIKKLAEKIVDFLSNYTQEGFLYPVDLRLRPLGREGELVQTADYLRYYFSTEAALWEKQAFLKARFIAGEEKFGQEIIEEIKRTVLMEIDEREFASKIWEMRKKIEDKVEREYDFRNGPGGLMDIYFLLDYLIFSGHLKLEKDYNVLSLFHQLEKRRLLNKREREVLIKGYFFLKSLDHKLRLISDRALDYIPDEENILQELAYSLRYSAERGDRFLLRDFRNKTKDIRKIFLSILST
ncbi:MAG: hypothetical protein ACE5WD_10860 [Candidatus Aminicenantia bacterium]